ncbi:hypothetical protein ACFW04_009071 [Cataglyphis niger]
MQLYTAGKLKQHIGKSLSCHPDKNPHNQGAVTEFYKLSEAVKLLSDSKTRYCCKKTAKERIREFDTKRKKFKDDLEAREEIFKRTKYEEKRKKVELDKLRREGEKIIQEETQMENIKIQHLKNLYKIFFKDSNTKSFIIKIKWHAQEDDSSNGGYNYKLLYNMFSKFGDIVLVVSSKGSAMVEFENKSAAETALLEIGSSENPLKLRGLWDRQKQFFITCIINFIICIIRIVANNLKISSKFYILSHLLKILNF